MIVELKWDSEFFGRKIGKLLRVPSERKIKQLINTARKDNYSYLSCRLVTGKISELQLLERSGFYATDIGVVWQRKADEIVNTGGPMRTATVKDIKKLRLMCRGLFRDSRFYNDPFFTYREADEFFRAWVENSVRDINIKTFIADGSGFITCRTVSADTGDIGLVGVIPRKQGKGIGRNLVAAALSWFKRAGVSSVTVRTQANNIRAMNFYLGMGFNVKRVDVTMGIRLNNGEES